MKTICVFGAGTYGSYLVNLLSSKFPSSKIILVEVGNEKIKTEKEIGFYSENKQSEYTGARNGRFFGLGGTSTMWGGQLLFFSKNDFPPSSPMADWVELNEKYKSTVLNRFFKKVPDLTEKKIGEKLFIKKGIWLKFNQRNLFDYFKIQQKENVEIIKNCRLIKFCHENDRIVRAVILKDDVETSISADLFYLTAGAFESLRILHQSEMLDIAEESFGFSDHISLRCFTIKKDNPIIENENFQFELFNHSLITSRIVGEIDNVSFYAHPIYNEEFVFFQFLKRLIFKKKLSFTEFSKAGKQLFQLFPFAFNYLFRNRLYVFKPWSLNIDIELDRNENFIAAAKSRDLSSSGGIEIHYNIPSLTIQKLLTAKDLIKALLIKSKIEFEEVNSDITSMKLEDIYHPYNLFKRSSLKRSYQVVDNLYQFNTGILKRSGGINPTAVLFCLIEKHIHEDLTDLNA